MECRVSDESSKWNYNDCCEGLEKSGDITFILEDGEVFYVNDYKDIILTNELFRGKLLFIGSVTSSEHIA